MIGAGPPPMSTHYNTPLREHGLDESERWRRITALDTDAWQAATSATDSDVRTDGERISIESYWGACDEITSAE